MSVIVFCGVLLPAFPVSPYLVPTKKGTCLLQGLSHQIWTSNHYGDSLWVADNSGNLFPSPLAPFLDSFGYSLVFANPSLLTIQMCTGASVI